MLKLSTFMAAMAMIFTLSSGQTLAAPEVGEPAPAFTGATADGETVSLDQYLGKTVVLEWTNHECPFVVKHYETGNMQALQKNATDNDVVWLKIVSSAPGKQGFVEADEALELMEKHNVHASETILDPTGEIGKLYDAQVTPHMYVIDAEGTLAYKGAIDDNSSASKDAVEGAKNYVQAALDALSAGEPVDPASTQPYGCSVKYM